MSNFPLGSAAGGPHKIINLKVAKTLGVEVGQPLFVRAGVRVAGAP
jgi:hypothetical protein